MDEPQRVRLRTNPSRPRHRTVACPVIIILAQKRYGSQTNQPMALQDIFRVPRDILGNPVPRCCTEVCPAPATQVGSHKFGRLIIFLHPLWNHYGRKAGRQAGSSNNRLFLPRSPCARLSPLIPARAMRRMMRCDAMRLCATVAICALPSRVPRPL